MRKFIECLSLLVVFIGLIFSSLIWFWLLYPYNTIEFTEEIKILNKNKQVRKDELLVYCTRYNKFIDVVPTVTRSIVDGVVYTLTDVSASYKAPGMGESISTLIVPPLPVGEYYLNNTYCYQVNPLRNICVKNKSEQFQIIE